MPVSKRINKEKKSKTTKVVKKNKSVKTDFVLTVKTLIGQYNTLYVLNINNTRSNLVKRIREDFSDSKLVFGKRRLLAMALGENKLSEIIKGNEGLMLSNRSYEEIKGELVKYTTMEYARTGSLCKQSVKVLAQPLKCFNVDLTPTLRDLGMSVEIKDGVIILMEDYQICTKGEQLTNSMTRLLKFFNVQIAEFSVNITAMCKDNVLSTFEETLSETNIPSSVEIHCDELDDGKYYFIPYPVEENDVEME